MKFLRMLKARLKLRLVNSEIRDVTLELIDATSEIERGVHREDLKNLRRERDRNLRILNELER